MIVGILEGFGGSVRSNGTIGMRKGQYGICDIHNSDKTLLTTVSCKDASIELLC
jgi:hypothetical protein